MAIPKIIHYCWFGKNKLPKDIILSMKSWKKIMPEYELILWNENNFDINSVKWTSEAYNAKKWAFVADYVRLYAVYSKGGIYLDTDIYVLKRFDEFLKYDYFTSLEYKSTTKIFENVINSDLDDIQRVPNIRFQSGLFGAIAGHPYLKDCINWYESHHFKLPNGQYHINTIASDIYPAIAQKYGFRYINQPQELSNNMKILSSTIFPQGNFNITEDSYAVHWWARSWRKENENKMIGKIKTINIIRKIFGKEPIINVEKRINEKIEKLNKKTISCKYKDVL